MARAGKSRKKILLVEDEPIIGRLLKRVLNAEGFEVDIVQDGRVAIEAVNNKRFDICISDIRLPGINGIQFYKLLKANHPQLSQNMIFITGDTMNTSIRLFLQESGIPYLMKPFNPEELVTAVKGLLK